MDANVSTIERMFKLKENNTTVSREIIAGFTTFMTMAYILAVNPDIMSSAGMDRGAVFTATVIAAMVGTLAMGFLANLPFALAPGMGLNAIFAFNICGALGYSWQTALAAVLLEGIIFIVLTFFNIREAIINAIPLPIKHAITTGIGFFIALIGFVNAGIVKTGEGTILDAGDILEPTRLIALSGLVIAGVLLAKNVKGAILAGILSSTLLGVVTGSIPIDNFQLISMPPSIQPIFLQLDFSKIISADILPVLFTLLFIDMFDTVGTLVGVCDRADMLDKDGKVPNARMALLADAIATTVGALFGASTVTTYVESASGVAEGGRTGLTAITTAIFFGLSLFFAPMFLLVKGFCTGPALILVGMFMIAPITKVDWEDYSIAIPAFLTMILMPFTYSIADGIMFGIISYVIINIFTGDYKKIQPLTYVIAVLSVINLYFSFKH